MFGLLIIKNIFLLLVSQAVFQEEKKRKAIFVHHLKRIHS